MVQTGQYEHFGSSLRNSCTETASMTALDRVSAAGGVAGSGDERNKGASSGPWVAVDEDRSEEISGRSAGLDRMVRTLPAGRW